MQLGEVLDLVYTCSGGVFGQDAVSGELKGVDRTIFNFGLCSHANHETEEIPGERLRAKPRNIKPSKSCRC